jgi:hypothetical protein
MAQSRIASTAKVVLYINGRAWAQATSFRWTCDTPTKEITGIDSSEPYELAPTRSKVTGQVALLRLVGDGGAEGAGAMVPFESLPQGKYFTLMLVDRSTDTQLFRADYCRASSQYWDVPQKGLITGSLSFEAISCSNELG